MRSLIARLGLVALVVCSAAACDATEDPLTPTSPSGTPVTETFSGTVRPNGGVTHQFQTTGSGTVQATLLSLTPNTEANDRPIGLGLGTWNGTLCSVILAQDTARVNTVITGTAGSAGALCVRIWDNGTIPEESTYEIRVVHP